MRRSQLAGIEQEAQMRMERLERRRGVTVGRTLVAAGVLVVERRAALGRGVPRQATAVDLALEFPRTFL